MEQVLWWLVLAVSMFAGSFLAGLVPLIVVSMSESKLRSVSAFGGGLLVGTVLTVVIPEGVETLFQALESDTSSHGKDEASHFIALSLLFGFGMMFIIDQFSAFLGSEAYHNHPRHYHPVASDLLPIQMNQLQNGRVINSTTSSYKSQRGGNHKTSGSGSAFLGVIVHCMADGVAMAAASFSKQDNLEMLVFMAIILHKVPTAFGLCSYMLASGHHSKRYIKRALVIFSLSAPLAFLSTLYLLGVLELDESQTQLWTGLLLLFSAGSFLYVAAVHVLPEIKENINEDNESSFEDHSSPSVVLSADRLTAQSFPLKQGSGKRFNYAIAFNTFFISLGMFLPLLLSSGHSHH